MPSKNLLVSPRSLKEVPKNRSAYNHYVSYKVKEINKSSENGLDKPFKSIMMEVSKSWKILEPNRKDHFKKIAEDEKKNYESYKKLKSTKKIRKQNKKSGIV